MGQSVSSEVAAAVVAAAAAASSTGSLRDAVSVKVDTSISYTRSASWLTLRPSLAVSLLSLSPLAGEMSSQLTSLHTFTLQSTLRLRAAVAACSLTAAPFEPVWMVTSPRARQPRTHIQLQGPSVTSSIRVSSRTDGLKKIEYVM